MEEVNSKAMPISCEQLRFQDQGSSEKLGSGHGVGFWERQPRRRSAHEGGRVERWRGHKGHGVPQPTALLAQHRLRRRDHFKTPPCPGQQLRTVGPGSSPRASRGCVTRGKGIGPQRSPLGQPENQAAAPLRRPSAASGRRSGGAGDEILKTWRGKAMLAPGITGRPPERPGREGSQSRGGRRFSAPPTLRHLRASQ